MQQTVWSCVVLQRARSVGKSTFTGQSIGTGGIAMPKIKWTNEMVDYLRQNYGRAEYREIAAALGVSMRAVEGKVYALGLTGNIEAYKKKRSFAYIVPLCDSCRYATALMCLWLAQKGIDPVSEYGMLVETATERVYGRGGDVREFTIAKVTRCERYEAGPLPPFGRVWPVERREVSIG
jgi:hypothetical protein